MTYVDVVLPLPLPSTYTYTLPPQCDPRNIQPGSRVIVPFGTKKTYTAFVINLHNQTPQGINVKQIIEILDNKPIILPQQTQLWQWLAQYYLCHPGDVYKAAIPAPFKLESESQITWCGGTEPNPALNDNEQKVADRLMQHPYQTIAQLQKTLGKKNITTTIRKLMAKGLAQTTQVTTKAPQPHKEIGIRLTPAHFDLQKLHTTLENLQRAEAQKKLLTTFIHIADIPNHIQNHDTPQQSGITRRELLQQSGCTPTVCAALVTKGILETYPIEHTHTQDTPTEPLPQLSPAQQTALNQINDGFKHRPVCLLHGITSSGKTEIYTHLIQQTINNGGQVLYMVPEIALTTQLTTRLSRIFGTQMSVYHSRLTDTQRAKTWLQQLSDKPGKIILGARSALFLPFNNLKLIIVDEEHDPSYKQQEPAPRYNGRDTAIMLANLIKAHTLLGTATPSLESYYNARMGKYTLVNLTERFGHVALPEIQIIDTKELRRKKRMHGPFSPTLIQAMTQALERKEQIILFQNRRGYAPVLVCSNCGWVPRCPRCDVSLTYHRIQNRLTCHYCEHTCPPPTSCPNCGETNIIQRGFGTEKIEDHVQTLFPKAHIARLDLDTTRTRASYQHILTDFAEGRTDILVGTQMVTKGLDFKHVSLVGILDADAMCNTPDFRSYERAYQLMSQVAGRAGRHHTPGLVILQTSLTDLPLIDFVVHGDYFALYRDQMKERHTFGFPPYCRIINLYVRHRDNHVADDLADKMADALRTTFGQNILGPDAPPVAKIRLWHIRKIMIKIQHNQQPTQIRHTLRTTVATLTSTTPYSGAQVYFDVDPA